MTLTGTVLGTPRYLSPEQAEGQRSTPASDLYALAVVAYELLSGERPFERESPTAEAAAHVNAPVPSISRAARTCRRRSTRSRRALARIGDSALIGTGVRRRAPRRALPLGGATRELAPTPRRRSPAPCSCRRAAAARRCDRSRVAAMVTSGGSSEPQVVTRTVTGPAGTTTVRQTVTHRRPPRRSHRRHRRQP